MCDVSKDKFCDIFRFFHHEEHVHDPDKQKKAFDLHIYFFTIHK